MPPNPTNKPTDSVRNRPPHAATVPHAKRAIFVHAAAQLRSALAAVRAPHPATVVQPKLPHLATIALPRPAPPATVPPPKQPHSASATRARAQAKGEVDATTRATARAGLGDCHVAQRYLQDVSEAQFGADLLAPMNRVGTLREQATREHWQKSGVEGNAREDVTGSNTVIAAARLEWFDASRSRIAEDFGPHISGFPFGKGGKKHYKPSAASAYEKITGCVRNCAERKLLLDIERFIKRHGHKKMLRICLYLYSEKTPCVECERALVDWKKMRPKAQLFVCALQRLGGDSASTWDYRKTSGLSDRSEPALEGLYFKVLAAERLEAMPAPQAPISSAVAATGEAPPAFWGKLKF